MESQIPAKRGKCDTLPLTFVKLKADMRDLVPGVIQIYGMADPRNPNSIRYVGKTNKKLDGRLTQHINERHRRRSPKNDWVCSLVNLGLRPVIWPLEYCILDEWGDTEKAWISFYRACGARLLNVCDGGDSGPVRSGWKHTAVSRALISAAGKGRKQSPEKLEKMRRANLGKKLRPETIEKIRLGKLGIVPWAAVRAAQAKNTGVPRPKALIEHLRRVNLARVKPRPIICIETQEVFRTVRDTYSTLGGKGIYKGLMRSIRLGHKCRGLHFQWYPLDLYYLKGD